MDRRNFIRSLIASAGALALNSNMHCKSSEKIYNIFPKGKIPRKLWAINASDKMDWHKKTFLTCFQGLINRKQTMLYLVHSKQDLFWLNYYNEAFGIEYELLENHANAVRELKDKISGYILYESTMPHSLNIAAALGAINNAVPVCEEMENDIRNMGFEKIDDLCGRWKDLYQAYEWALNNVVTQCNTQFLAQLCVHNPYWPSSTYANRDYTMAHNILSVDISSSERDKKDYHLLRKIYQAYQEGTIILGWHCVRDKEHEAIALSSEYGHYGMCTLRTANLTVHSSIQPQKDISLNKRSIDKQELQIEEKVYIAYMTTDGDAAWFVQNLINTDWANPLHGSFKYNWGFLPMAYDLMPGMVQYYHDKMQPNDFFVAGPSGATYTYPHLHPNPEKFLLLSEYYMEKCGLTTVHMTNWNDRDWWQEVDLPKFHNRLRENLPNCIGYVRGMGESAFEKHYIAAGKPYIFCGEGIHKGSDIYQTVKDFIDACPNRPLFIYNLVNHTIPMDHIKKAMDRFPDDQIELVHLDELLLLIEKAFEKGLISEDLYPNRAALQKILSQEAREAWPNFYQELLEFNPQFQEGEIKYIEKLSETAIGLEYIDPAEFLAFTTIWHAMKLVKLALESRGIYVNHKPTATKDFINEFSQMPDVAVIVDLQELWDTWHQKSIKFKGAKSLADRMIQIAKHIDHQYFKKEHI
jgi:hypothetical protein